MKKIGHESLKSYKMLKFKTVSFSTPRKYFPIMFLMLLILFRFAMCCICYTVFIAVVFTYLHGNLMFMSLNY